GGIPPGPRARAAECDRDVESRQAAVGTWPAPRRRRARAASDYARSVTCLTPHQPLAHSHCDGTLRRGRVGTAQVSRVAAAILTKLSMSCDDSDSARQ